MKSNITGKRIKKDPVFEGFRKSSVRMKDASPIASAVYQQLPVKYYPLYREMTGKALLWLKEGIPAAVIRDRLIREYLQPDKPYTSIKKLPARPMPRKVYKLQRGIRCKKVSMLPDSDFILNIEHTLKTPWTFLRSSDSG